ncbi:MAG: hypothetical protein V7K89_11865 [Nostoc sp.]|uniref:hypothetical protein n=1 Tax=Nostoc sp. TaxID=1180 RepID=UPI002FF85C7D
MVKKLPPLILLGRGTFSLKQFRADCYEAARTLHARVLEVKGSDYHSYSVCNMQLPAYHKCNSINVTILRNGNYPIIGFSSTQEAPFIFLDVPRLQEVFEALGYEVWSKEYLETDPIEEHITDLTPQEIEDYNYWRPNQIGQMVFNFYD